MKSIKKFTLVIIFLIISINHCFAISQEELIDKLISTDDHYTTTNSIQIGLNNLNMISEILLMPTGHPLARSASLSILGKAFLDGLLPKEQLIGILINQIKNIQLYSSHYYINLEKARISNMLSYLSYCPEANIIGSIEEDYGGADLIITKMKENDLIKNNGIKNSLTKKYQNSLKSLKKGNKTPAINQLEAAKNEINAQSGKGIDTTAANILIRYTRANANYFFY